MPAYLEYVRLPSEVELAYIAGMMDGEGTITIAGNGTKQKNNVHGIVCIANNNLEVLEWIRDTLGIGNIYTNLRKHGISYTIQFYKTKGGRTLIQDLLPFLHIKKKNAELILEYWVETDKWSCDPVRRIRVRELKEKINWLNRKRVFLETRNLEDFDICDITGTGHCGT